MLICLVLASSTPIAQAQTTKLKVNQQRIQNRLLELSKIGALPNGGAGRVGYSKADQEGRAYFIGLMKKAGLAVSIDYAGNIIGRRKGQNASLKPIAFGSHIDSVPNGGNYDGPVGSIGALEVIEILNENNIVTGHPLELIIFSNEEGGTVGSGANGKITPDALKDGHPKRADHWRRHSGHWRQSRQPDRSGPKERRSDRFHRTTHRTGRNSDDRKPEYRRGQRDCRY